MTHNSAPLLCFPAQLFPPAPAPAPRSCDPSVEETLLRALLVPPWPCGAQHARISTTREGGTLTRGLADVASVKQTQVALNADPHLALRGEQPQRQGRASCSRDTAVSEDAV